MMRKVIADVVALVIPRHGRAWNHVRDGCESTLDRLRQLGRRATRNGIFYREAEMAMCSLDHRQKLLTTMELFQPKSVLDLGCGTGVSLDFFLDQGVEALGLEGSRLAINRSRHPECIRQLNLNHEIDLRRQFDLIWCVEVVEHIHPTYVQNLMSTFRNHSHRVVLSAARPGQGGEGHFNEQPPAYWITMFGRYGFDFDERASSILQRLDERFSENMLVFCR